MDHGGEGLGRLGGRLRRAWARRESWGTRNSLSRGLAASHQPGYGRLPRHCAAEGSFHRSKFGPRANHSCRYVGRYTAVHRKWCVDSSLRERVTELESKLATLEAERRRVQQHEGGG